MKRTALILLLAGSAGLGCSRTPSGGEPAPAAAPGATAAVSPAAQKAADELFANRCTPCHGVAGRGDGAASASLTPRPRNFHDPAWQKSVPDEYIEKIIQYGGSAVGKSAAMPANPDLGDKPDVVAALRKKLRAFGQE